MVNRGEIVENAIIKSGFTRNKIAEKLEISPRQLYNYCNDPGLKLDVILEIGHAIGHDFTKEIPELGGPIEKVEDISGNYRTYNLSDCIQERDILKLKYYELLEKYAVIMDENKALTQKMMA